MGDTLTVSIAPALAACAAWKAFNQHVIHCAACRACHPCPVGDLLYLAADQHQREALASGHLGGPLHG